MNDFNIYAFSGKIGSGKDFVATQIFPEFIPTRNQLVMAFSDHFKIDAIAKYNLDRNRVFGSNKDAYTRQILQKLGTEEGRDVYGEDHWCNILNEKILMYRNRGVESFIITDLRFLNEFSLIKSLGGCTVRIEAPERTNERVMAEANGNEEQAKGILQHRSETELDSHLSEFDIVLHNEKTDNVAEQLSRHFGLDTD